MQTAINEILITIVLAPLIGSAIAGLCGYRIGRAASHWATITGVAISLFGSLYILYQLISGNLAPVNITVYQWTIAGDATFQVGFLVDKLTAVMMFVVTAVSLAVHVYTIGYMVDDPGYQRFFSFISLFTFAMLMLVMANNFMQLFFGWEAVGLVSYLLIGFWYTKESAIFANLKAFLVNRVGDFGFLLGIAAIYMYFGSLDYNQVFAKIPAFVQSDTQIALFDHLSFSAINFICITLFIGAMGKSAQIPFHVWLPDSMEGPTPISALIHAATMVTAGVFMVTRMSPLFEHSEAARSFILIVGGTTALFMGLLGIVMNDIKRIIAYSTLSQLGYMMTALGASAYSIGIFHLMTHAFFKALLFLGAGSVIIGMHHEQDIRKMGNLRKYMPITYFMMLIGSLALTGIPPFSGFYSKDMIIEAVHSSTIYGANYAYYCILVSVFVTAFYSFRLFFMVFHTEERMDGKTKAHLHESPSVVWGPLVALAIPSAIIGYFTLNLFTSVQPNFFESSILVLKEHDPLIEISKHFNGPIQLMLHGLISKPLWLAIGGILAAWLCFVKFKSIPNIVVKKFSGLHRLMLNKYGIDDFNQTVFANGAFKLGDLLWKKFDIGVIDNGMVNGSAKSVGLASSIIRHIQSGYLYHYAFVMVCGLLFLMIWLLWL